MPVITLKRERFSKFVERQLTLEEMTKWLPWLGFDIEEVGTNFVKVEFNPNRIDFSSYVGVARAFKGIRGWETGLPEYKIGDSKSILQIDRSVAHVRPYMLGAVVRGLELDEEDVIDVMEIQEDLHWGIGRDRKKASIGIHNLDVVTPPFKFTTANPHEVRFVPLGKTDKMTLHEILEKHEKGISYRHLIDHAPQYPLLIDKEHKVLSMPPIINGELTKVDEKTRNLFLDVTGTDLNAVGKSLNVLASALADMGGLVETVNVKYPDRTLSSPNLEPAKMKLRVNFTNKTLGLRLSDTEIVECLERCRLGAKSTGKGIFEVELPAYRIDILHEIDLVEEVATGYGYYKLKPTFPQSVTIGQQHPVQRMAVMARQIMVGLGFIEVMNFTLTNEDLHFKRMLREARTPVKLANPISREYTIMRQDLLPGLMKNLEDNKHESFPQRLFEVSDVVQLNEETETQVERKLHVAAVSSHSTANFTEIKSAVEALLSNIGLSRWKTKAAKHPSLIEGRSATISVGKRRLGIIGEVSPHVLRNFTLENPTCAFEINLEVIMN